MFFAPKCDVFYNSYDVCFCAITSVIYVMFMKLTLMCISFTPSIWQKGRVLIEGHKGQWQKIF